MAKARLQIALCRPETLVKFEPKIEVLLRTDVAPRSGREVKQ